VNRNRALHTFERHPASSAGSIAERTLPLSHRALPRALDASGPLATTANHLQNINVLTFHRGQYLLKITPEYQ